jgi:hypothetical protein
MQRSEMRGTITWPTSFVIPAQAGIHSWHGAKPPPVAVTFHPVSVTLTFFSILYTSHEHPVFVTQNPVSVTHHPVSVTFSLKKSNTIIILQILN